MQETASSPQNEAEMVSGKRIARFVDEMASGLIGHKHLVESLMVGLLTGVRIRNGFTGLQRPLACMQCT